MWIPLLCYGNGKFSLRLIGSATFSAFYLVTRIGLPVMFGALKDVSL